MTNTRKLPHILHGPTVNALNVNFTICNPFVHIFVAKKWRNTLKYVRIYSETKTFDKITKERAAKFEDMLSAIGGTMGLLTGFSIISGVEILYFGSKIVWNVFQKKSKIISNS